MKTKVQKAISDFDMLKSGDEVLVGLSGGADSVALLLILNELGYKTTACHINHQLRGEESDRDENFCVELCRRLQIKLFVEKIDINTFCKERKFGIEEGARLLRYQAFEKYSFGAKIATAHTTSDNLETVLINLTRGTALKGLCGIPPVRNNIIRPLIYCTRDEIENYLKEKNQDYVIDSTNLSCDYTRNKMRHEVIPKLAEVNPSLYKSLQKTISSISRDNLYLEKLAQNLLIEATISENTFDVEILRKADISIMSRCIAEILKKMNLECTNDKVNDIIEIVLNEGKINLSGDVYAISNSGKIKICSLCEKIKKDFSEKIDFKNEYTFYNKKLHFCVENINYNNEFKNINKKFANQAFDYDKIQGKAIVRNRKNGDKIKFFGKPHTTKIKTLFNSDIPQDKRDEIIFIADEVGVIFVEGYGVAERVKVDENTKTIIKVNIIERIV